jgi:anaerobic selenocysteine-containing dehydrogenase
MTTSVQTMCRVCANHCALQLEMTADGRHRISGVKDNPLYRGYSCVKGRAQTAQAAHPDRLLQPFKRIDGDLVPISTQVAITEVAARLTAVIEQYGPQSVAIYTGNGLIAGAASAYPVIAAFLAAIGSTRSFTSVTLDKPGKSIAKSLHGEWGAPAQSFHDPEVALFIGINPLITYTGLPAGNPGKWLADHLDAGMQLIVIDPRRSDIAKRATLHIQNRPGSDVHVLAAMLKVILDERRHDQEFVAQHTTGLEELRAALEEFTPERAAAAAGVEADAIVRAARIYADARRGYTMGGTGLHMAGYGTLAEYLILNLETICGRWLRSGDLVPNPGVLLPPRRYVAEARPPGPARFGEQLQTRGLRRTAAGLPTAAIPDEVLAGEIRALISLGGNPVASWPDQLKTIDALKELDLFVQVDPWLTESARAAHYVVPPPMALEVSSSSFLLDVLNTMGTGYSTIAPYAQYAPAVQDRPTGSDLLEEWEFIYELGCAMGLRLDVLIPGTGTNPETLHLDSTRRPSTDELLTALHRNSRIPLEEVRRQPGGVVFDGPPVYVEAPSGDPTGRLQLADPEMMSNLQQRARTSTERPSEFPFRLICRRMMHVYNSMGTVGPQNHKRLYNPAFMAPADLEALGLADGDEVLIGSRRTTIIGVVHADDSLLPGLVSMAFGFGGAPDRDSEYLTLGSNTNRLLDNDIEFDPYSGQPRMSDVPVSVTPRRPAPGAPANAAGRPASRQDGR